jgi:tRNA dimethylallyltransferase
MTAERVARRVDAQFERGLLDEVRRLLAGGVPDTAHPFTGLVYRQALEHLRGVRGEAATRDLIVRENRRYSRRQLIWFRKEPNLHWIHAPGERAHTADEVARLLVAGEAAVERTAAGDMETRRDAADT